MTIMYRTIIRRSDFEIVADYGMIEVIYQILSQNNGYFRTEEVSLLPLMILYMDAGQNIYRNSDYHSQRIMDIYKQTYTHKSCKIPDFILFMIMKAPKYIDTFITKGLLTVLKDQLEYYLELNCWSGSCIKVNLEILELIYQYNKQTGNYWINHKIKTLECKDKTPLLEGLSKKSDLYSD